MAQLGINVAPDADPSAIAATGASFVRCVYRDTIGYRPWLTALRDRGVSCVFVGDGSPESLSDNEGQWAGRMTVARSNYGDLVKNWQWGNEPDGSGMASWTMSKSRVNRLLEVARGVFPTGRYTLVAPGMVSGQPSWLDNLRLDLVDAVDAHPYAKLVDTARAQAELKFMLNGYLAQGKPLWLLEYDSRTLGLSGYLRDFPGVERAAVMAWDNAQTDSEGLAMGLKQNPAALADFTAAAGGPIVRPPISPPENRPHYVLGFAEFAAAEPALVGEPLEDERGGVPDFSQQRTSRGILTAANLEGQGWRLLFWDDATGGRYLFDGRRAERIA